jgi:YfiH family protein
LNLSRHAGDDAANVATNLDRLHRALDLDARSTVSASQAQADCVATVCAIHRGTYLPGVDALLTDKPGVPLLLRYADCVPICFFDPTHYAIGVVHAGWRGTVMRVAEKAARAMMDAFGTSPHDLRVGIGPSIGPCCYRVGHDVIARVRAAFRGAPSLLHMQDDGTTHLDLWEANAQQLRALGVEQIEIAGLCTADRTDEFYSWRAERANTGRFGAIIALRG